MPERLVVQEGEQEEEIELVVPQEEEIEPVVQQETQVYSVFSQVTSILPSGIGSLLARIGTFAWGSSNSNSTNASLSSDGGAIDPENVAESRI